MRLLRLIRTLAVLVVVLAILAAIGLAIWIATHREQARTWRQGTVIGARLSDIGALDRIGDALAVGTQPARTVNVGPLPSTLVTPDGDDDHPAIVLLIPEGTSGADEQRVRDAQHAIAAADLSAWAVRVPPIDESLVDAAAYEQLVAALEDIAAHDSTEARRVSVVAAGASASLVLVAAANRPLAQDLRAIVAVQPIADVRSLVALATTGRYRDTAGQEQRVEPTPELRASAGRALLQVVRQELPDGGPVLDTLLDAAEEGDDPLAALEVLPPALVGPALRPLLAVLRSESLAEFDAAWKRLSPAIRDAAQERSPLPVAEQVTARVLMVEATEDAWAQADVARLADALPVVRSIELDPQDPASAIDDPVAVRDLLSVSEWWLRTAGA